MSVMLDFFTMLYEGFKPLDLFYIATNDFSENMYNSGGYVTIGLIMLISSLISELMYYYFLSNYGSFYKRIYWFLWIVLIAFINFFIAYSTSLSVMTKDGYIYTFMEYFAFSMVNVLWTMTFCFLFSIACKLKSVRASKTPF